MDESKWVSRLPDQGFFVTTDLSTEELAEATRDGKDTSKWDKYLEKVRFI